MNNKHTVPMLRIAAKSLGRLLRPQANGLKLQTFDATGNWGVTLMVASGDVETAYGNSEREALYNLTVKLAKMLVNVSDARRIKRV